MAAPTQRKISIEITSDTICLYCYIGYNWVKSAIDLYNKSQSPPVEFSIRFSPYLLNSALPPSPGLNKMENYERKLGPERAKAMVETMTEHGKMGGVKFSIGGRISNTVDSHRVLEKVYEKGGEPAQRKVAEAFFKHYFEEEGDIGDHEALAQKVDETGVMTKEETLEFLKSEEMRDTVEEELRKVKERGIKGVPYMVINGKSTITGAEEPEKVVEVFKQAATMD